MRKFRRNVLNSIEFEWFILNVSCFPLIRSQPSYTSGYINSNSYAGATSAYATDSYASGHGSYNDVGNNLGPSDSYTGVDSYKAPPSGKYPNPQFFHFSYKRRKMSIFSYKKNTKYNFPGLIGGDNVGTVVGSSESIGYSYPRPHGPGLPH